MKPPLITLYTHDNCSLCDDLVEELEMNFSGRFQLEKIDITKKENLKFLRLYRLDIPVCFLNGQVRFTHSSSVAIKFIQFLPIYSFFACID